VTPSAISENSFGVIRLNIVLDHVERKIMEAAKGPTAMIIRRPVLSVGCAKKRRVAESNPQMTDVLDGIDQQAGRRAKSRSSGY
jgi:hypothetical protein